MGRSVLILYTKMSEVFVFLDDKNRMKENKSPEFPTRTTYKFDHAYFTDMNNMWYGVFKAINLFEATKEEIALTNQSTMRQLPFCRRLRYVFADLDVAKSGDWQTREEKDKKKEQLISELNKIVKPNMIINTSNGIQPLRKIDVEPTPYNIKSYTSIIQWIIKRSTWVCWKGDQVKDITRILRIPWFYHHKQEPYLITCTKQHDDIYTLYDLAEHFWEEVEEHIPQKQVTKTNLNYQSQEIESIDFEELIIKAYRARGINAEFDTKGRVIEDGRLTGTFRGKNWDRNYLASNSHDPKEWNRITAVAMILQVNNSEARKWIIREYNIKDESEYVKKKEYKKVEIRKEVSNPQKFKESGRKLFTFGIPDLAKDIGNIWSNELVLLHWLSKNWKTTVSVTMCNANWMEGKKVALFSLEMTKEYLKTQQALARAWIDRVSYEKWNYSDNQWSIFMDNYNWFDKYFTIISEDEIPEDKRDEWFTLDRLCEDIRRLHKDDWYDLFVIDSLKLIKWKWNTDNNTWEWKIVSQLVSLKKELPIAIVVIHHNNKVGKTYSWSQDLENFVDWRIEVQKIIDENSNWVSVFNQTIIRIHKERIGKELEFLFNFDKWELLFVSSGKLWSLSN